MIFENSYVIKGLMTWNHSSTPQMCVYMRAEKQNIFIRTRRGKCRLIFGFFSVSPPEPQKQRLEIGGLGLPLARTRAIAQAPQAAWPDAPRCLDWSRSGYLSSLYSGSAASQPSLASPERSRFWDTRVHLFLCSDFITQYVMPLYTSFPSPTFILNRNNHF